MNSLRKSCTRLFSTFKVPEHKIVIDAKSYRMAHPVWSLKDAENVEITHYKPQGVRDWIAFSVMKTMRVSFDILSGYKPGQMSESKYLQRMIFLETVAGVPGMMGAMVRHLKSLGYMREDGGWIHHLIEEAENERMHLFTFLNMRSPGIFLRMGVLAVQWAFLAGYTITYGLAPKYAHRFVGYLEEEAVKTYTNCIKELDEGKLPKWKTMPAHKDSIAYWGLPENATFRDVLLAVRADECMHREVNHHLANIDQDSHIGGHNYTFTQNTVGESLKFEAKENKEQKKEGQ